LALKEVVGKEAFLSQMHRLFEDATFGDKWNEKKCKFDCSNWIEDVLNDALYNTMSVLEKCRKC
jgi:hypothetical protein